MIRGVGECYQAKPHMPITQNQLIVRLADQWKEYMVTEGDKIVEISLPTENYTGATGEKYMPIVLKIEEDGRFLKMIVPGLYSLKAASDRQVAQSVHMKLLQISWETKLVQFEYDNIEQEIRGIVEMPVEDSVLTAMQIQRGVQTLHSVIDYYHNEICSVIEGKRSLRADAQSKAAILSYSKIFNSRKDQELTR